MKIKFYAFIFVSLLLAFSACEGSSRGEVQTVSEGQNVKPSVGQTGSASSSTNEAVDMPSLLQMLDELAALERAGSWLQGMALTESEIRENAGDYAGAVAAAYKELALAYGRGLVPKEEIEQGLLNLLDSKRDEAVTAAANAILAFSREQWDDASAGLERLFDQFEEPDSFGSWMILVCALEKNCEDRRSGSAYKAIRARYAQFPEYWYRGARAFSGVVAAEYAENCINSSPQGPFAAECRKILAAHTGLNIEDGLSIKTKREIEAVISQSVNTGNPQLLDSLLPLIGLPDNPYTIYAVGALRALTSVPVFRDYFAEQVSASRGRLAERLSYIARG